MSPISRAHLPQAAGADEAAAGVAAGCSVVYVVSVTMSVTVTTLTLPELADVGTGAGVAIELAILAATALWL